MMVNKVLWLVFFMNVSIHGVQELGSYERVEDINGMTFKQKLFFDNDEVIKDFFVNGEPVVQEIFQQKKYDAHEQEIQMAQQRLKNLVAQETESFDRMRAYTYIKLIQQLRELLQTTVRKIYEKQLQQFWAFDENNISSAALLDQINQHLIPSLAFVDDSDAEKESVITLRNLFEKIEQIYQMISQFYQNTVAAALEQSDDPTALKKLLELKE